MPAERTTSRAKRRWWQLVLRGAALAGLVLAAAYVTLPWWAPSRFLGDVLARKMSRQMGVGVSVGQVRLSWSEGVELRELIVDCPPGFGTGPMVRVKRIQADLSPIDFFFRKRIEWMEVFGLQVFARVDADGNVNISRLKDLVFGVVARRVSVHEASAALELPGYKKLVRLNIRDLQLHAGRLSQIGRVTMAGDLDQQGRFAPVSLRVSEGAERDPVAAVATFTFADVDLEQTPLASLLSRTVSRFAGRCGGSVELKINRQGIVVPFALDVSVRDLDVQPARGPRLPVVKAAGLRVAATYDMITGRLDVSSSRFRLPGIDLAGRGTLFLDLRLPPRGRGRGDEPPAAGGPQAQARSLKLSGRVYPGRLASLLTGRTELPGGLGVTGPVAVNLRLDRRGEAIRLDLSLRADDANVRRAGRTIKPPGRKLAVLVRGELNTRTWIFSTGGIDQVQFVLGSNWLQGTGRVRDVRGIARRWANPAARTVRQALADLNNLSWRGEWEISDLDALRDLWPGRPSALDDVKLTGRIQGRCSVEPSGQTLLRADATIGADARLSVADLLATPAGQDTRLAVSGALIAGESPGLRDTELTLIVGGGRAHLSGAQVRLAGGPTRPLVEIGGRVDIENIESLLATLRPGRLGAVKITGQVRGAGIDAGLGPARQWARADLDLTGLDLVVGDALAKPSGRRMKAEVSLTRAGRSTHHWLALEMPEGRIDASLSLVGKDGSRTGRASCKADLADAAWLVRTSPVLRKLLGRGRLAGPMLIQARARWTGDELRVDLAGDADGVTYRSGGASGRAKAAGVDLGAAISVRLRRDADRGLAATAVSASAEVELGRSRCTIEAGTVADLRGGAVGDLARRFDPQQAMRKLNGRIEASCVLDPALLELFPELGDLAREHGLAGTVEANVSVDMRGERGSAQLRLDADRLRVRRVRVEPLGRFAKPAGLPGRIRAEVSFAHDLSDVRVRELYARAGDVRCTATGRAKAGAGAAKLTPINCRLTVRTQKAETLQRILPALKEYRLAGDALLEVGWENGPKGGRIARAELRVKRLRGRVGGKQVAVGGRVAAERVSGLRGDVPTIGRIVTDGLSLRVGGSNGWVLADLTGIPARPAGSVWLLAGYLDQKELTEWLERLAEAGRGGGPATKPRPDPRARAGELISRARKALASANLAIRGSFDRLRTYDAKVRQFYQVRQLDLAAAINRGVVRLRWAGGLNGGTIRARAEVDLGDEDPAVKVASTLDDVLASKSILPQLRRFFPGNTLYGSFSRTERTATPLRDFLANLADPRIPVVPVGTAKLVATDGLVEGRAAPHFVAAIFPGLNLARYRYNRMTSFTTFRPDGVAENDMIFNGPVYDMYMEGTTDARHAARYEVGIILLSSPQSPEWNHEMRLGRIPILKVKGLIRNGKLVNDEVSYPWPTESLFTVFLKNNIFYRMWLRSRKAK